MPERSYQLRCNCSLICLLFLSSREASGPEQTFLPRSTRVRFASK